MCKLASGVSIITSIDAEGRKVGIVVTSLTSVSLDPPLLLVCIDNRSWMKTVLAAGLPFNVHILTSDQEEIAKHFASRSQEKFSNLQDQIGTTGCPTLPEYAALLECVSYNVTIVGDHTIVIGRVSNAIVKHETRPLVYHERKYLRL